LFDLLGVATALAALRADDEALEVAGLAEGQGLDVGGPAARTVAHLLGTDLLMATEERTGAAGVAELKARGRAAPAGSRVARACQLARLRQLS